MFCILHWDLFTSKSVLCSAICIQWASIIAITQGRLTSLEICSNIIYFEQSKVCAIFIIDLKDINNHTKIVYADDTNCVVAAKTKQQLQIDTEQAMVDLVNYYENITLK